MDIPAAPIKTNVKAHIFIFFVMRSWASSERKSSARRSTVAAKIRRPDELVGRPISFNSIERFVPTYIALNTPTMIRAKAL